MKDFLAYLLHLTVATLVVPFVVLASSALLFPLAHSLMSAKTAVEFYSDHLLVIAAASGLWVSYLVCDTFSGKNAAWVWIPSAIVFLVRLAAWKESVLFHSSLIEHFFTANCQIENWRSPWLMSNCADKLFLSQLLIGALAYSVGAEVQERVKRHRLASATR